MGETYYDVLGVDPDASADRIEAAYRERVLETHPDRNDDPDAAEAFKRVCDAEAVLGDPAERARYDRLGHEAYCRLGSVVEDSNAPDEGADPESDSESQPATDEDISAGGSATASDRSDEQEPSSTASSRTDGARGADARRNRDDGRRGRSHHARQRARRRRRSARYVREAFGDGGGHGSGEGGTKPDATAANGDGDDTTTHRRTRRSRSDRRAGETRSGGRASAGHAGTGARAAPAGGASAASTARASDYAVHGWTDEVELTPSYRELNGQAIVTIGFLAQLYPVFVAASITPAFPLVVNATVAGCTLLLVGYLLTVPRIAIGVFGVWSVVVPLGLSTHGPVAPTSGLGLLALGACWTPLGYAVAVWWVLRP
ncbi:J domain-containing protein [Halovivax limisalsi]|uniref:J domain-containing protein n=1 Tax=Halovivax limisalsi TaxID=1453760 RepID=UPI001FFC657F|nr:DnaJ domain-containing protein [Halovivax limisalsi]